MRCCCCCCFCNNRHLNGNNQYNGLIHFSNLLRLDCGMYALLVFSSSSFLIFVFHMAHIIIIRQWKSIIVQGDTQFVVCVSVCLSICPSLCITSPFFRPPPPKALWRFDIFSLQIANKFCCRV